jgi:hypothetical protein
MWHWCGSLAMMAPVEDFAAPDEGAGRRNGNR